MHTQIVTHKDINPHNRLVHKNPTIYTDFGSSLDYIIETRSITTGLPNSITRRYAASEVHASLHRSSKSDIFSLGYVYLEILGTLGGFHLRKDMTPYGENTGRIVRRILDQRSDEF